MNEHTLTRTRSPVDMPVVESETGRLGYGRLETTPQIPDRLARLHPTRSLNSTMLLTPLYNSTRTHTMFPVYF